MTKRDLIEELLRRHSYCQRRDIEIAVNTTLRAMTDALKRNDRVEIRGFGTLEVRERQPRSGRNPRTGQTVQVGPKKVPFFRVGKELRERVNGKRGGVS
jgi:integration host factor subunit beta